MHEQEVESFSIGRETYEPIYMGTTPDILGLVFVKDEL